MSGYLAKARMILGLIFFRLILKKCIYVYRQIFIQNKIKYNLDNKKIFLLFIISL